MNDVTVEEYETNRRKYWENYREDDNIELGINEIKDMGIPLSSIIEEAEKLKVPFDKLYLQACEYYGDFITYYLNWKGEPFDDIEIQIKTDKDVAEYEKKLESKIKAKQKREQDKKQDEKELYLKLKEKYGG